MTTNPSLATLKPDLEALQTIIERCKIKSLSVLPNIPATTTTRKPQHPYIFGLPPKYNNKSFVDIQGLPQIVEGLRAYTESVFIHGPTGTGKTHLAIATAKESICESAIFVTAPELLLAIRSCFSDGAARREDDLIQEYTSTDLLILDDLGAEKSTEYSITTLYLIIDRRDRSLKRTIITSNLSLQEISEKLDARIASRLSSMKIVNLSKLPDYRKKR